MIANIINIGSELLNGRTVNTNLIEISKELRKYGFEIDKQISIRDDRLLLYSELKSVFDNFDGNLIIITGGLGPTEDDITTEIVSKAIGAELILDTNELQRIKDYYLSLNRKMPKNNLKQAYFPKGYKIIINNNGTASGYSVEHNGFDILVLPGPPTEMLPMLKKYLKLYNSNQLSNYTLNLFGKGESLIETEIRKIDYNRDILEINTYVNNGIIDISIEYNKNDEIYAFEIINLLKEKFKDEIFYENLNTVESEIVKILINKRKTLTLAESITGGLIANRITNIPGASNVLIYGGVTYTENSKIKELYVKKDTLDKFSAVSSEVCEEMLIGLATKYDADYRISITGYAGPDAGDGGEVGLVYIGIGDNFENRVFKSHFIGNRERIKNYAANKALIELLKLINKN
ncbi:MAG: nicotinamide-nucleotide amidohydrolase family protein [Tissierellia bacterium]|nr:nicotinamide-nucleotide amidohydrolase family protein [Tissierellia bacterium]